MTGPIVSNICSADMAVDALNLQIDEMKKDWIITCAFYRKEKTVMIYQNDKLISSFKDSMIRGGDWDGYAVSVCATLLFKELGFYVVVNYYPRIPRQKFIDHSAKKTVEFLEGK